jgi:hypothetical protein
MHLARNSLVVKVNIRNSFLYLLCSSEHRNSHCKVVVTEKQRPTPFGYHGNIAVQYNIFYYSERPGTCNFRILLILYTMVISQKIRKSNNQAAAAACNKQIIGIN